MEIKENFLTPNPFSRPQYNLGEVKGILVHWVANANTSALANRNYFNNRKYGRILCKMCNKEFYGYEANYNGKRWLCPKCNSNQLKYLTYKNFVSTHYIIGLKGEIIQCLPLQELSYHTGKITKPKALNMLTKYANYHSIGIECCHINNEGIMNRITYTNLTKLIIRLLKKYDLDINNLFLHYDMNGKICHKWFVNNPNEWILFKELIHGKSKGKIK